MLVVLNCEMSNNVEPFNLSYIEELIERYKQFDYSSIELRYLLNSVVLFEKHIEYLESVIKNEAFCTQSESWQDSVKTLRIKFRVDVFFIKQKIGNCSDPDALYENSDDEVDR